MSCHMSYTPIYRHSGGVVEHLVLMYGMACTLGDNLFATPAELGAQWDSFQGRLLLLTSSEAWTHGIQVRT